VARLSKSNNDAMLTGVCGGIAEYFDADPTWVRIAFVVTTLMGGPGLIAYLIGAALMPRRKSLMEARYEALSS
jgi:phage shock protein C